MNIPKKVKRLYLVGLMGAGKTTVGRLLATVLDWDFVDMDQKIEALADKDIPTIFETEGEAGFRAYESKILKSTVDLQEAVIACGGGVVTRPENIEILNGEITVWLDLSPAEAAVRLEHSKNRPLLNSCDDTLMQLNEILIDRRAAYKKSAIIRISSGGLSPEIIASDILSELETRYG